MLVVNNFNDTDIFNLPLDLPENAIYELVFSSSILALFQLKLSALQLGGRGKYHDSTLDNLLSQTNKVRSLTRKILKQKNTSKYLVQ
ncbi:hypothetical protein [Streptococcus sp. X13SY08]|uniref:hypothetical protein n=1 Tax=Streptococcus sp. X13SY08 TaxID=1676616 RepID=UPI001F43C218|nr:hypothetical protein [Streptococcus sp. X13SY08]